MCQAVEEYAEARAQTTRRMEKENTALKMLKAGKYAVEEIVDITGLPLSQVQALQKSIPQ